MKKRFAIAAAGAVLPALLTLCSCITEQEPMPPGVFIQTPAPDTGAAQMPPAAGDSFKPAPQEEVLPPAPAPAPGDKDVKKNEGDKKAVKEDKKPAAKKQTGKKPAAKRPPAKPRTAEEKYIVKKGDNLSRIAYRYHITVKKLQEYNKLKTTVIHPKQVLLIPASDPADKAAVNNAGKKKNEKAAVKKDAKNAKDKKAVKDKKDSKGKKDAKVPEDNVHIVRAGEDFTRIARLYKLKVSDIQKANPGVDSRRLRIGQKLKLVPGAKAVTGLPENKKPAAPVAKDGDKTPEKDDLFNDGKNPEELNPPAPVNPANPANPVNPPAATPGNPTPSSAEALGSELDGIAAPATDEVVTMDGGKQAVTIRAKDTTIDELAKRFNTSAEKIREANGLLPADGSIKIGTKVIIP